MHVNGPQGRVTVHLRTKRRVGQMVAVGVLVTVMACFYFVLMTNRL